MKTPIRNWSEMADWGHYNRNYLNAIMKRRELFEVRVGVCKKDHTKSADSFTWSGISGNPSFDYRTSASVRYAGPISLSGDYSFLTLQYEDFIFDLEFACSPAGFVYKASPVTYSRLYNFTIGFYVGSQTHTDAGFVVPGEHEYQMYNRLTNTDCKVSVLCESWECRENLVEINAGETIYISNIYQADISVCEKALADNRKKEYASVLKGSGSWKNETVQSMIRASGWNKIYDHVNDAFQIDVTRLWSPESCYYSFYWDNLLDSLPVALQHKESAYDQFESICSEFKDGYLPQCSWEWGSSAMINPPIGSYCLWKVYQQFGDKELLEKYFSFFYDTNRVLFTQKNDGVYGLISLFGSSKTDQAVHITGVEGPLMTSALATGLDNSHMYDKKENFIDVGMSSIYVLDCLCLSLIAKALGDTTRCQIMREAYDAASKAVNESLWDEQNGIYCNRGFDGAFKTIYSPTSFYPLLACSPPKARQERLIKEHLLNESEFWGKYVLPSVDKRHPSFKEQNYWRGCAWAPMNFLVYEGLRNSGDPQTASLLAAKSVEMYQYNWDKFGWVLENYNTITGSISENCVPMYTWGILMAYIGAEELFRPCLDGVEFGNFSGKAQGIENMSIGDHRVSVYTDPGLSIYADGRSVLETDIPVVVKISRGTPSEACIHASRSGTAMVQGERVLLHPGENLLKNSLAKNLL